MIRPATALASALVLLSVTLAPAEPILKPHKYYGPIPQSSVALRIGMMGGAQNTDMVNFLDNRYNVFNPISNDFGNGLTVEASYVHKPHPQFGLRLDGGWTRLRSNGKGTFVPPASATDTTAVALDYTRDFNVDLFVLEGSGIYFFSDASVNEFQAYAGGGFSVGLPHQTFKESRIDQDTGQAAEGIDESQWQVVAGVHAILGANYYLTNTLGISAEGRLQLMQSKFDRLQTPNETGQPEQISFNVDYTGFYISVGMLWAF